VPSIRTITGLTRPVANRPADYLKVSAFAAGVLLVEAILARGAAAPQLSKFILLFLAVVGIAFVFRFPLATALALLALSDFLFHPTFFALSVGALDVRPHEVALGALLLVALVRPESRTWGGVTGAALAIFLLAIAVSGTLAFVGDAAPLTDVFNWARPLGLLTFFYVVVRLFPNPRQRGLLLVGAAVLAAATGVVALMISLGAGFGDSLQEAGGNTVREQEGAGSIDRVRLAGLSLGYALFWYAAVKLVSARGLRRLGWAAVLGGISLDIVVSFNRNMWFGLAIGFGLMTAMGGALVRSRLVAALAVGVAGIALFVVFGSSAANNQVVTPVVQRGATILNPKEVAGESSFEEREQETKVAWRTARENPLFGVGAGAPFGILTTHQIGPHSFERTPRLFLHNQYLYLLLIAGIPGLLAFLVFLGVPLARSFRRTPADPAIAACGVAIAMIMISSVVAIYFTVEDMTAVLGLLTGVLVADAEGRAPLGEDSGLLT